MDQFISTFRDFDKSVRDHYANLNLKCLDDVEFDSKKSLSYYSKIMNENQSIHNFHSYENYSELAFISGDIKYYTAILFLLKNYINNPLSEQKTYFQKMEDKRYLSYAVILFQTFYNYWDRIGDLIYCFLKTSLNKRNVYFVTVIENIAKDVNHSASYIELNNLYESKLKDLFSKRKEIVHYLQLASEIHVGFFKNFSNDEELVKSQNYKESLPEYFKENIDYTFKGFKLSLELINEFGIKR